MPAPAQTTFLEVVNLVAKSVGHPVTTDVASSTDEAILRLGYYANQVCTELAEERWEALNKSATLNIVADSAGQAEKAFDLPSDFHEFVDETQWNNNTQLPAIGPVSPQDWRWLIVRNTSITTRFMWRIRLGKLYVKSPPYPDPQVLSYEYMSKNWCRDADDGSEKDLMSKNGDYHVFAWNLVVLGTRAKWLKNEGYDSSSAEEDFKNALESHLGGDKGNATLSLVPGVGYPYIDVMRNAPPTGYGET